MTGLDALCRGAAIGIVLRVGAVFRRAPRHLAASGLAALLTLAALSPGAVAQTAAAADAQLVQDYVYGYAPVAMAALRALMTAVPDATRWPGRAPVNELARVKRTATPSQRFVPRPSADVLYTLAWLDLAREPMVLHVPEMRGRYHLIPLYDAYSNQFASIGSRTTGDGAGDFAILGPGWQGALPAGLRSVQAPTNSVWLIARTLVRGPGDLAAAVAATRGLALVPLGDYPRFAATGRYAPAAAAPPPLDRDFVGRPITSSPGFSRPDFFALLRAIAARDPPPPAERPAAARFVEDGYRRRAALSPAIVAAAEAAMRAELRRHRTQRNGWSLDLDAGDYGTNYLLRAAIARFGLGANRAEDAVYPSTSEDSDGRPLQGGTRYVLHFPPGGLPPVKGFWSLTLYDSDGFLVANPIDRYCVGSETGLVPNPDGSTDILLQGTAPAGRQANWLPTPPGRFSLTLRLYWPDASVLDGRYRIPPVEPVGATP
jgi:hypothetical protein